MSRAAAFPLARCAAANIAWAVAAVAPAAGQAHDPAAAAEHVNRLARETSPYLLQHARNPVNWYPWGPEAFEAARRQDKPIFLSVGYSTCYWCHVMERESFEDPAVAAIMNEHVISIKVDREERPDVDDVYMASVHVMAGRGGWPMSVFLEPRGLKPFRGGTYFPPQPRYGKPSFTQLLKEVSGAWRDGRQRVLARAEQVAGAVRRRLSATWQPRPLDRGAIDRATASLLGAYDAANGGLQRGAPKFPQPVRVEMLAAVAWDDPTARDAIVHTLDRMAMGGIYDQVGGGFHRYSTDARWLVPHFEKMLYDNGQLAALYARAYELTGDAFYGEIVRETLDYVLGEMTTAAGGFASAQDAEVNAREGASYVWTPEQVRRALEAAGIGEATGFALQVYGLDAGTNFRDPHHPAEGRRNVLHLPRRPDELAEQMGMTLPDFNGRLDAVNEALLAARDRRPQPLTDDKVITEWNGLMIAGMVRGARALGAPEYERAAERAARFILERMATPDGGVHRTYREGQAKIEGFSGDYAQLIRGLLALHGNAQGCSEWLDHAERLAAGARRRFWDDRFGGYFDTLADSSDLFVRKKSTRDGVIPSANSTMLNNLLDLYELTGKTEYLDDATAALNGLSSRIARGPTSTALAVMALHRFLEAYPQRVPGASPEGAASVPTPVQEPVKIDLSARAVRVTPEAPGELELTLEIEDGYHINAHEPGLAELIGVQVQLVGRGYDLAAEYPDGEPFSTEAFPEPINVHTGTVTIPLSIRATGGAPGPPRFVLTYQVCTDTACLAPARALLPIRVE